MYLIRACKMQPNSFELAKTPPIYIYIIYITPLQTVRACRGAKIRLGRVASVHRLRLMVIRKVIPYVPYREKPYVDSESSTPWFKIGSNVTF